MKTMLLIDDEENLLRGLKAVMQKAGYTVYAAGSGQDGISLAKEHCPDVIVCDVMMPPPNGFQLKKILAEDPQTASIPFIFLTARTFEEDKIVGLNIGADDYVTKPFSVDELLARVEAVLRRHEISRQVGYQQAETMLDKLRVNVAMNLSHEFRTPLGIILTSMDLALQEHFKDRDEDLEWFLRNTLNSAHQLSMLVNDLILLYDIDQGQPNTFRRVIDLRFHFLNPINKVIERWEDKKLEAHIKIEPEVIIHAPEIEFSHAVSHLVDNACKFSPEKTRISVHLEPNGVGGCVLTVSDEGISIPAELHEKVFERYYQIHQGLTRPYHGLGVGLTIARAIAEAGGGSLEIVPSETGNTFRFIYPPGPLDWDSKNNVHTKISGDDPVVLP